MTTRNSTDRPDITQRRLSLLMIAVLLCVITTAGFTIVLLNMAARYEQMLTDVRAEVSALANMTDAPTGAMLSFGTGGFDDIPYSEWLGVYAESTLWPFQGAVSLRFTDHAQERGDFQRDFEIGFYRYGPAWYSRHFITEFWLGDGEGGVLSVAGNDQGGGELQVRNPLDTDAIRLNFTDDDHPFIGTESGRALYLTAEEGVISENEHIFNAGITIASESGSVGIVTEGWRDGQNRITAAADAHSLIFITPLSEPIGKWWLEMLTGEGFIVHSSATDETMQFQWLVIGVR